MQKISGVLPINKPSGISSYDVIRQIKRKIHIKKIGHGGTLDMLADGVLPILIGDATKIFDFLLKGEKIYRATVQFGAFTETDDSEGDVIKSFDFDFHIDKLKNILPDFQGTIQQLPPKYSALRVNGKRSYELARENKEVPRKLRTVTINSISIDSHDTEAKTAVLTISCFSGTYIRSIGRDLGEKLGWGAYLSALTRLKSGGIVLDKSVSVDDVEEDTIENMLIDLNTALCDMPMLELTTSPDYIYYGKCLSKTIFTADTIAEGVYRIVHNDRLIAIIRKDTDGYKYLRVFPE